MRRAGWISGAVLAALAACSYELGGEGDVAVLDASVTGPNAESQDTASPKEAPAVDAGGDGGAEELIVDEFDDPALVDDTKSVGYVVAGGALAMKSSIERGTGADGACVVTGTIDLTATTCVGRPGPDVIIYAASQPIAAQADTISIGGMTAGLAAGDEIVILDMQGPTAGRAEFRRVASVTSVGLSTTTPLSFPHGAADRPAVQRVPNYASFAIAGGGRVVAPAWDGTRGGALVVRVRDAATIAGALDASGAGYRGGARPGNNTNADGFVGESALPGFGSLRTAAPNGGGGGAGRGDPCGGRGVGAGGGGHGTVGGTGGDVACGGQGGAVFGGADRLSLGGGGGSGGNDNTLGNNPVGGAGGRGGGAIFLEADTVTFTGLVLANGTAGQGDAPPCPGTSSSTAMCWDFSGPGGGGAGGAIWLRGTTVHAGSALVRASGGSAGIGVGNNGGVGGAGRVTIAAETLTGTTVPTATIGGVYPAASTVVSKDLLLGRKAVQALVSLAVDVAHRPSATKVKVSVSTDGTSWYGAMPPNADTLEDGTTTVPLDVPVGASLFYQLRFEGDQHATARVERVRVIVRR